MADEVIAGTVNWFNVAKGYGFITRTDGAGDVFVHQSDLHSDGFRSLREGEEVEFKMGVTETGRPKAVNVTGPSGAAVQGVPRRGAAGGEKREPRAGTPRVASAGGTASAGSAGGGATRAARPPREEPEGEPSGLQVVVLNLPWSTAADELKEFMAPAGAIESCEIASDASGRSRGYGTVRFASKEEADKAVSSLNQVDFQGRPVTIKLDRFG